jgi:hypothetical protein
MANRLGIDRYDVADRYFPGRAQGIGLQGFNLTFIDPPRQHTEGRELLQRDLLG